MSNSISEAISNGVVTGEVASGFEPVADAFIANFKERGELGANVCVTFEGETVVDLSGGIADPESGKAWDSDALSIVFSCTKGLTALVAHMLIDQGKLDPHAPVAELWPEFATNGKENATVRMMMNHTVGLPVFRDPVPQGMLLDWEKTVETLAAMEPFWSPGDNQGYHAITYAWTIGEVLRRATGKSVGTLINEMLAAPLGLDLWCGLPEAQESRVAPMQMWQMTEGEGPGIMAQQAIADPSSIPGLFLFNDGGFTATVNSREAHAAEIPSANGITNGRGLAGAYRPFALGGSVDGKKFVSPERLAAMSEETACTGHDQTLVIATRFGDGFMKSMDNRGARDGGTDSCILGRSAFGHVGAGGSIGFADPDAGMSFGYNMNKMGASILLNERGQSLVDAAYKCAGYRTNETGYWIK